MTLDSLLLDGLAAAIGSAAAILALKRYPLRPAAGQIEANARKAFRVMGAKRVSDRRKEMLLPRYALRIFLGTFRVAACLTVVLAAFVAAFAAVRLPFADAPASAVSPLFEWETQLAAAVVAIPLFLVLGRRTR